MPLFDLLIQNALIYDGDGGPPYQGDLAVRGEKIVATADRNRNPDGLRIEAETVLDGTGLIATPGFVDVHSHSDMHVLINPNSESKIHQGVTTEIIGQCGYSAFPLRGKFFEEEREESAQLGLDVDWHDAAGYFARLEQVQPAVNLASFIGHGNVRSSVMGFDDRPPVKDEMAAMQREIDEAMEAGAFGLSTGLIYTPGMFSDVDELTRLARAAAQHGGMYASHVRGEGDTLLEAGEEFLAIVRGAECQGQFSHLKASGKRNWGKVSRLIGNIEEANADGVRVRFDKYPYIASSTGLASLLPRWVRDGGRDATLERLADTGLRARIIQESEQENEGCDGWASVIICGAGAEEYERFQGWSIAQIAGELGISSGEVYIEFLTKSRLQTSICNFTMSQEETDMAVLHPLGMIGSDSSCQAPYGVLSQHSPHPRAYGTFGKFFREYVRERKLLKLEEAIAKVTSLPCETFGLRSRGRLAAGYHADVVLIDWPKYQDRAEYASPHIYCDGVKAVIVNGTITVQDGQNTGKRNGKVLRRGE